MLDYENTFAHCLDECYFTYPLLQSSVTSNRGLKATEMILKHLEAIDKEPDPEAAKKEVKDEDNFDDLTLFDVSKDEEDDSINASSASAAVPGPSIFDNSDFGKLL